MKLTVTTISSVVLALLTMALLPDVARSIERGTLEIGVDGAFIVTDFDSQSGFSGSSSPNLSQLSVPARVRFGAFASEKAELDFMVNLVSVHQGNSDVTTLELNVGIGFHPSARSEGSVGFFEPQVGLRYINIGSGSATQFTAGAEAGVKLLSTSGLAGRISATVNRAFESNSFLGSTTFGINFGVSFLTKKRGL